MAKRARVLGVMAACHASRLDGSTKRVAIESLRAVCVSCVTLPPYSCEEATISSPGSQSVMSTASCAAMPLAKATAPAAPSSDAMRSSRTAVVGLPMRV